MSIEKKAEALIDAVADLINSINSALKNPQENAGAGATGPGITGAGSATQGVTVKLSNKKETGELKKQAKLKAGEVLKTLGKEKLKELLSRFGCEKFPEMLDEAPVYSDFIIKAEAMLLPADSDDDLLGGESEVEPEKEYTAEDVKALFLKINNHPDLGRDVTKQLLAELGVVRLPELKKEKFATAVKMLNATLSNTADPGLD